MKNRFREISKTLTKCQANANLFFIQGVIFKISPSHKNFTIKQTWIKSAQN